MFSNPPSTFAYCKSWGVGVPQGLGLRCSQIRVRVGLGPCARPGLVSGRPPVPPVHPPVRPPVPPPRPPRFDSFSSL